MIEIIGNIKVDESKPERVKQLIACIRSYSFLGKGAIFVLYMEDATVSFRKRIEAEAKNCGFLFSYVFNGGDSYKQYGVGMRSLINFIEDYRKSDFVINFMEDQFMMLDNANTLMHLIGFMKQYKADVCKASFFQVEQNSIGGIKPIADVPGLGIVYENAEANHVAYCSHYKDRYFIGVNFLTTREFALKFWNRELGPRPHPYEVGVWSVDWQHRCVIPHIELQGAIDDCHGEPGTSLLQRQDAKKFWDIYNTI